MALFRYVTDETSNNLLMNGKLTQVKVSWRKTPADVSTKKLLILNFGIPVRLCAEIVRYRLK